jgi:hypothetical protein
MAERVAQLLRLMIAAGGPQLFDAREQWPLHRGLTVLAARLQELPSETAVSLPELAFRPDPDVGRRAAGVTRALWEMTGSGDLVVTALHGHALFHVKPAWLPTARQELMRLEPAVAEAIYLAATCWAAAASMSAKNARSPVASSA